MMWLLWLMIGVILLVSLLLLLSKVYHSHRSLAMTLLVVLPLSSVGLYHYWGDHQGLAQRYAQVEREALVTELMQTYDSPQDIINTLKQHLANNPDEAHGWFLLSRIMLSAQQWDEADVAIDHALALDNDNVDYMLQKAEVLYLRGDRRISNETQQLLDKVLQRHPQHPYALNMLAADAYHQQDYAVAMKYWRVILEQLPPGSESHQSIQTLITQTEAQMDNEIAVTKRLQIAVSVADELKAKIQDGAVILVYARAPEGPSMPLAIIRQLANVLPATFVLDDGQAMLDNWLLSQFDDVEVVARIAQTGQAQPQAGDLYAQRAVNLSQLGDQVLDLVIDSEQ